MTAIDELRHLLDERGVAHRDHYLSTTWRDGHGILHLAGEPMADGSLVVDMLTPEQAIAATLGGGECEDRAEAFTLLTNGTVCVGSKQLVARIAELQSRLNNVALGGGKLTADQVREAIMSADRWEKPMGNTGLTNTHLIIRDDGWQAIADELNEALGGRECEMVTSGTPSEGNTDKRCTSCGAYNIGEYYDGLSHIASPKFCPNCGRAVRK